MAAAIAAGQTSLEPQDFLDQVLEHVPRGRVYEGIRAARGMADMPSAEFAAYELGNGRHTSARDTVPFALWVAARNLTDYEQAFWTTAAAGGDVDHLRHRLRDRRRTCGLDGLPERWRAVCEPLPDWAETT